MDLHEEVERALREVVVEDAERQQRIHEAKNRRRHGEPELALRHVVGDGRDVHVEIAARTSTSETFVHLHAIEQIDGV